MTRKTYVSEKIKKEAPGVKTLDTGEPIGFGRRLFMAFRILLFITIIFVLSSWSLVWAMGWAYIGLWFIVAAIAIQYIAPDTIRERLIIKNNIAGFDKKICPVILSLPVLLWMVCGLDERFGWSPEISLPVQLIAFALFFIGHVFTSLAMIKNKFFSSVVRIQKDRGQVVVDSGPYRLVRHPGYLGGMVSYISTPVALGSYFALIPAVLYVIALAVRTAYEDDLLKRELLGYLNYAKRVRYRLLPGVW